jgi:hypothetical protein
VFASSLVVEVGGAASVKAGRYRRVSGYGNIIPRANPVRALKPAVVLLAVEVRRRWRVQGNHEGPLGQLDIVQGDALQLLEAAADVEVVATQYKGDNPLFQSRRAGSDRLKGGFVDRE